MEVESETNRLQAAFRQKSLLNIYFTAGFPRIDDTLRIAKALADAGADMIEIGLPFSDPIADGPTIQASSQKALANGMSLQLLLDQLADLREQVDVPVLLMGYINPVLQYGFSKFCAASRQVGIDGLILPDLPMHEYQTIYKPIMKSYGLANIFLITPQTGAERIREIDKESEGFIYMVSSSSTTGAKSTIEENQVAYFERIKEMGLNQKRMIGFGISNRETFQLACDYADGAIIGSAFIRQLAEDSSNKSIYEFVKKIKN